ncbi:hypothetical protein NNJEOMEG_02662 [Fundidesulfovibrio magnetotacticus]|uniref:DUF488 domain-containing protein n=1 Tax=Fundidesulfovibrio magnetotacticus TaxID=2730080 RepID=A0A6V8LSU7_9BACT|nr:DUF488 domain-containing protein [Fundidesulfovibrio magnetotacticus]GFK94814.1 hypothetical protein NNJEOMEG_02662 [Fundidesulfovibrio magnetotacticus]
MPQTAAPTHGPDGATVQTIGLSNHSPERFLELLRLHGIDAVADVRSRPYARYAKHFRKEPLERLLRGAGVAYVFLGHLVGGKPDDPALLGQDGLPDYERIAASPGFAEGIARIVQGARRYTVALACAEEDPSRCHRSLLIAPALAARGVRVLHIRGHGGLEPDAPRAPEPRASLLDHAG